MTTIARLTALEILDSRGRPTIKCTCRLTGGHGAAASVPSGASTGAAEALELRDRDATRYRGLGCRQAVGNITGEIDAALRGRSFANQAELDAVLIELDGTSDKSRLGANALLAVSLAFARAAAGERGVALYRYFESVLHPAAPPSAVLPLPRLTINLFSGGKHAGGQVPIQDVLMVPLATRIDDGLAMAADVYASAAALIDRKYGMRLLRADEGGLAPPCAGAEAMLHDAVQAIEEAGLRPGRDMALALDVASSHFYRDGRYDLDERPRDSAAMIEVLLSWLEAYPIVSLEDGLAEDDWENWPLLRAAVGRRALVLGDDFLCTNPRRIERAIEARAADALLLKVNQIGTLSEAATACRMARAAPDAAGQGWKVTVSARSGETEDDWLADLAVGWSGDQIKVGSITGSERLAKYNRLLEIEAQHGWPVVAWPG